MKAVVMGREFVAELLGTMVLIMFGCGSVAQSVKLDKKIVVGQFYSTCLTVAVLL